MTEQIVIPESFPASGDVAGKRVVITGASRGLGCLLAHALARRRPRRAVARTERDLKAVAAALPGPGIVVSGDVTDEDCNESVADAAVAEWGGLDVWICNAGVSPVVAGPARDRPRRLAPRARCQLDRRLPRRPRRGPRDGPRRPHRLHGVGPGRPPPPGSVRLQRVQGRADRPGQRARPRPRAGGHHGQRGRAGMVRLTTGRGIQEQPAPGRLHHGSYPRSGAGAAPRSSPALYQFLASDAAAFVTGTVLTVDGGYLLV